MYTIRVSGLEIGDKIVESLIRSLYISAAEGRRSMLDEYLPDDDDRTWYPFSQFLEDQIIEADRNGHEHLPANLELTTYVEIPIDVYRKLLQEELAGA